MRLQKSLCPSMLPRKCWKLYPATDYIFSHGVFNHKVEHHTVPYQPYDVLVGFSLTAYLFQLFFEQAHPLKLHFRGLAQIGAKLHLYHSWPGQKTCRWGGVVVVNFIGSLSQQVFRVVWLSIGTLSLNGPRTCLIQITWTTKLLTFRDWPTYHDSPIKLQQALGQSAFGTNWRRQWGGYFWKDLCESSTTITPNQIFLWSVDRTVVVKRRTMKSLGELETTWRTKFIWKNSPLLYTSPSNVYV